MLDLFIQKHYRIRLLKKFKNFMQFENNFEARVRLNENYNISLLSLDLFQRNFRFISVKVLLTTQKYKTAAATCLKLVSTVIPCQPRFRLSAACV